ARPRRRRMFSDSPTSTTTASPAGVSAPKGRSSMSMRRFAGRAVSLALVLGAGAACGETPNLGRPISEVDIAAWDISILPDGRGLPAGSGTAAQGKTLYAE